MKEKFVGAMQTFSKAIVAPVLYLPAVGLILVICNFMINPNIVSAVPFLGNEVIQIIFKVMYNGLMSVFNNLGPIFAIGVAFGLAKKKKGTCGTGCFPLSVYLLCCTEFILILNRYVT